MKLYATITDSKGKKDGRGDNDYLEIMLTEGNENRFLVSFDGKKILVINYSNGEKTYLEQAIKQKGKYICEWCKNGEHLECESDMCQCKH
jgi:hypothetical protein